MKTFDLTNKATERKLACMIKQYEKSRITIDNIVSVHCNNKGKEFDVYWYLSDLTKAYLTKTIQINDLALQLVPLA